MNPNRIAKTNIPGYYISTVKLGISFQGAIEYETMAFATDANDVVTSWLDVECIRSDTRQQAVKVHDAIVKKLSKGA